MKQIKLIATDMDGTLLDSQKRLPRDFFEWVNNHSHIRFVIASGRQYYTLRKDFIPVHNNLIYIAENGSIIYDKDKVIYLDSMKKDDVLYSLDLADKLPTVKTILCGVKSAYMTAPNEEERQNAGMYYERLAIVDNLRDVVDKDEFLKLAYYFPGFSAEANFGCFDDVPAHLNPVLSGVSWVDIANKSVNKGAALREIQKKYNIDRSECIAFGDYLNDYDLLMEVDESYCMENGHEDMKKIAKYIAPSNDDNGVMKVLHSLAL